MTREEAINDLKDFIDIYLTCHGEEDTVAVSLDNVDVEALHMAIKALQEPRWIPVSEELPKESVYKEFVEPSKSVLVQLNNGEMKVSRYWGSRESYKDKPWIDLSYPTTLEVVAWMPLLEPYKAESEESE